MLPSPPPGDPREAPPGDSREAPPDALPGGSRVASDAWDADVSREIARTGRSAFLSERTADPQAPEDEVEEEIEEVPVRRRLSVAIAGFAALVAVGLILGAQTSGPDARTPYAIVIFGVQLLFVLAWAMATRPPAAGVIAGICAVTALVADWVAVTEEPARLLPLIGVLLGGFAAAMVTQLVRAGDRSRLRESSGNTFALVGGVVGFASLIVLTRIPVGTQAVLVCLAAAGVALVAARLTDAVYPKPRMAPQVPRGSAGVVLGAMLGALAAAALGSRLVLPFTPANGAVVGLIAAGVAVMADLAVNYSEAGRGTAEDAPTFWVARHMQGPLGAFAAAAPVAYAMTAWVLS